MHSKNDFAIAIIAGDLFVDPSQASSSDDEAVKDLLHGSYKIPLPTYFGLGKHALPQVVIDKLEAADGEVCENLFFLGKRTTIKTSEGLRIIALGGCLDRHSAGGISKDKYSPLFNEGDARALRGANAADILVTYEWPANIRVGSKVSFSPEGGEEPVSHQCIADLCAALKPRYHFSASADTFWEREPFFHESVEGKPTGNAVSRFINLAPFNNPAKQKWVYAFSIEPGTAFSGDIPAGATASPLVPAKKRPQPAEVDSYRFSSESNHHRRPHKRARAPPAPSECFFCLSNPDLATHLIGSIGTEAYLTTAKGPLTTSTTFPALQFPAHVLIIPMTHAPTLASIADTDVRKNTYEEMEKYRKALQAMVEDVGKSKLGAITWEVSRAGGVHAHWQFLPVPIDLINRGLVDAAFKVEAQNETYPDFEKREAWTYRDEPGDFFRALIWRPNTQEKEYKETSLILPLDESFRFDLQFGRRVLAKLLGLESRTDWRTCGQSQEEEVTDVEAFKQAFKRFDFSMDD